MDTGAKPSDRPASSDEVTETRTYELVIFTPGSSEARPDVTPNSNDAGPDVTPNSCDAGPDHVTPTSNDAGPDVTPNSCDAGSDHVTPTSNDAGPDVTPNSCDAGPDDVTPTSTDAGPDVTPTSSDAGPDIASTLHDDVSNATMDSGDAVPGVSVGDTPIISDAVPSISPGVCDVVPDVTKHYNVDQDIRLHSRDAVSDVTTNTCDVTPIHSDTAADVTAMPNFTPNLQDSDNQARMLKSQDTVLPLTDGGEELTPLKTCAVNLDHTEYTSKKPENVRTIISTHALPTSTHVPVKYNVLTAAANTHVPVVSTSLVTMATPAAINIESSDEDTEETDALYIDTTADLDSEDTVEAPAPKPSDATVISSVYDSWTQAKKLTETCGANSNVIHVRDTDSSPSPDKADQTAGQKTADVSLCREITPRATDSSEQGDNGICNLTIESVTSLSGTSDYEHYGVLLEDNPAKDARAQTDQANQSQASKHLAECAKKHALMTQISTSQSSSSESFPQQRPLTVQSLLRHRSTDSSAVALKPSSMFPSPVYNKPLVIEPIPLPLPVDGENSSHVWPSQGRARSLSADSNPTKNLLPIVSMVSSLVPDRSATQAHAVPHNPSTTSAPPSTVQVTEVSTNIAASSQAAPPTKRRKRKPDVTMRNVYSSDIVVKKERIIEEAVGSATNVKLVPILTSSSQKHVKERSVVIRSGSSSAPRRTTTVGSAAAYRAPGSSSNMQLLHHFVPYDKNPNMLRFQRPMALAPPVRQTAIYRKPPPAYGSPGMAYNPYTSPSPISNTTPSTMYSTPHPSSMYSAPGSGRGMSLSAVYTTPTSMVYTTPKSLYTTSSRPYSSQAGAVYTMPASKVHNTPTVFPTPRNTVYVPRVTTASRMPASTSLRQLVINAPDGSFTHRSPGSLTFQPTVVESAPTEISGRPTNSNMAYILEQKLKTGQTNYVLKTKGQPACTVRATPTGSTQSATAASVAPTATSKVLTPSQLKCKLILGPNVLPSYKAPLPPPHLRLKKEDVQHHCQECGDIFALKSSLEDHLNRKSMLIKYQCDKCREQFQFYNKCALLSHVRKHSNSKNKGLLQIQVDRVQITPLPQHLMPKVKPLPSAATSVTSKDNAAPCSVTPMNIQIPDKPSVEEHVATKPAANQSLSSPTLKSPQHKDPVKNPPPHPSKLSKLSPSSMVLPIECSECHLKFRTPKSLSQHYLRGTKQLLACHKCLMVLPHLCAYQAHCRIHSMKEPYVCPDCGLQHKGPREAFMRHIKRVCLHFSRQYEVVCPCCSVKFHMLGELQRHIEEAHKETYCKCLSKSCFTAFKSWNSFMTHNQNMHNGEAKNEYIYKCPLCDTVYQSLAGLTTHISHHVMELEKEGSYVYKCMECKKVYAKKLYMKQHMLAAHPDAHILSAICEGCQREFVRNKEYTEHISAGCLQSPYSMMISPTNSSKSATEEVPPESPQLEEPDGPTEVTRSNSASPEMGIRECDRCQVIFGDEETYKRHMSKHLFLERKRKKDQRRLEVTLKKIKVEKPEKEKKVHVEETTAVYTGEVKRQVPVPEKVPKFGCPECQDKFHEEALLEEHLKESHGMQPQHPCHLCGLTYSSEHELKRHLETTHESGRPKAPRFTCWWCLKKNKQKSYSKRAQLEHHLKHFHRLARTGMDISEYLKEEEEEIESLNSAGKSDAQSGTGTQEAASPRKLKVDGETQFVCAKCSYSTCSREEFSAHIPKHKTQTDSVQCLECGLCFTVQPTLKMHLIMVHKVQNFAKYAEESGLDVNAPPPEDKSPLVKPTQNGLTPRLRMKQPKPAAPQAEADDDNDTEEVQECTVCYKTFDDEISLHKHMRTHGMAFIRSRRLQNVEFF